MTEKHLPPLDLTGPASQVADRWRKWKRAFEYYAEGKGIDNVRKKTSQLLHFAGMEVQDIFEDLQDPGPVPAEGDNAYKVAIRKLDFYFRVEENIPYERHVFRQLSLQEGETADQFMVRLRKQARHCNFGTSLNDNLRDQLIEKLTDFELKRKLLEQRNITLEEALDKARAWEAAGRQATNMTMNPVVVDSVNAVKTKEEKEMTSPESATIVEERDIWPLIGAALQKERNVRNVGGMVILLCVVRARVIMMQIEVNWISDGGVLIDVSLTMLTLWAIRTHLTVRRTVLLHLQLQKIKEKDAMQLILKNQCWK